MLANHAICDNLSYNFSKGAWVKRIIVSITVTATIFGLSSTVQSSEPVALMTAMGGKQTLQNAPGWGGPAGGIAGEEVRDNHALQLRRSN